jgi:hypothetical protein
MGRRGPKGLPADEHRRRGNWRADRHQEQLPEATPGRDERVSEVDRAAVLSELDGIGHSIARDWLDVYVGWDQVALFTVKQVGLSATRLEALVDEGVALNIDEIHKEIASYVALVSILQSEQ